MLQSRLIAPHHLGGNGEEMGTILPAHAVVPHQAHVGFVHEGGRLERVAAALAQHIAGSQAAELCMNDGSQAIERSLVSVAPGAQERADVLCTQFVSPIRRRIRSTDRLYRRPHVAKSAHLR